MHLQHIAVLLRFYINRNTVGFNIWCLQYYVEQKTQWHDIVECWCDYTRKWETFWLTDLFYEPLQINIHYPNSNLFNLLKITVMYCMITVYKAPSSDVFFLKSLVADLYWTSKCAKSNAVCVKCTICRKRSKSISVWGLQAFLRYIYATIQWRSVICIQYLKKKWVN